MPRVKKFDENVALSKALELFWEKGYEATSLSDLTGKLNIGKGSFYDTFGSKRAIFDQCLSVYQSQSLLIIDQMLESNAKPKAVIKKLLNEHTKVMLSDRLAKGCFIANSTAELADDKAVQSFLKEHNEIMRSKLNELFTGSKYEDRSAELSDLIITQLTGISIMSKFVKEFKRFEASNEVFLEIFN